jgi:hypothetical protein
MKRCVLFYTAALLAALLAACDNVVTENEYYDNYISQPRGIALSNAADLAKIGVDEGYPLDGAYYLDGDIDLSELEGDWIPIGTAEAPFSGILNGYGRTIRGLTLPGGDTRYTGLFGYLLLARLTNLTIEVENTEIELSVLNGGTLGAVTSPSVGVAAGHIKTSYIEGITIKGTGDLKITKTEGGDLYAGGLAGALVDSMVSNIKVNLNLAITFDGSGNSTLGAGLVAGSSTGGSLASCFAEGSVEATATRGNTMYVGGIVGNTSTLLENCTSAVTKVYGENSAAVTLYVGGIAGMSGSLVSCGLVADHTVIIGGKSTAATGNVMVYVGGMSGNGSGIDKGVADTSGLAITAEAASPTANLFAGGIAGQGGNISRSFVRRGAVLAKTTAATGTSQNIYAGGISGFLTGAASITNCFSNANVTVENAQPIGALRTYRTAAGGIAGYMNSNTHIIGSGASGTVKTIASNNTNNVAVFAGGIAGAAPVSTGVSIERSAALNGSVTVEAATPHAYRILGGAHNTANPAVVTALEAIPTTTTLTLYGNYALEGMTVQTITGTDDPADVPQTPNNAANLMGSGNLDRTQAAFEEKLGWNFETDWTWDDAAKLPVPRYN